MLLISSAKKKSRGTTIYVGPFLLVAYQADSCPFLLKDINFSLSVDCLSQKLVRLPARCWENVSVECNWVASGRLCKFVSGQGGCRFQDVQL